MKYNAVSEKGEFVVITVEPVGQVSPAPTPPSPTIKPIERQTGHKLTPSNPKNPTSPIVCSCGAKGYVCKRCMKVNCEALSPSADEVCPNCQMKIGGKGTE